MRQGHGKNSQGSLFSRENAFLAQISIFPVAQNRNRHYSVSKRRRSHRSNSCISEPITIRSTGSTLTRAPPEEPEARWKQDIELMVAAGMNCVRMGEFAWGICEPEEGQYDFAWLRRVMDLMGEVGHQGGAGHADRRAADLADTQASGDSAAGRTGAAAVRRHAAGLLFEQRSLLGLFQENRPRHGGGAGQTSAADRLAN